MTQFSADMDVMEQSYDNTSRSISQPAQTRRMLALAIGVIATLCVLWFVPTILSSRVIWPRVASYLTSNLEAKVSTGTATLGWLSPVELRDVRIVESDGQQAASIQAVRTEKTLLSLLLGRHDLGEIHIQGVQVALRLREHGSNVEEIMASLLSSDDKPGSVGGKYVVSDGTLEITDERDRPLARIDSIQAVVEQRSGSARPDDEHGGAGSVEVAECHVSTAQGTGSLAVSATWKPKLASTDWALSVATRGFDLSLLQPLARRWGLAIEVTGQLDLQARAAWESASSRWMVDLTQAEAHSLRLEAPAWLGQDHLAFDHFQARGTYAVVDDTWRATHAEIQCDAGRISLNGQFRWPPGSDGDIWAQLLATEATAELHMNGRVDLARLAASLPRTLRVREDSVIESGTVEFELTGQSQGTDRCWTARLAASQLAASRQGQRLTWDAPLQLTLAARRTADQWQIEQFTCRSSSLNAGLDGTAAAGSFTMQCNVEQLVRQLREFLAIGTLDASGNLNAHVQWQRDEDHQFTIQGTGLVECFGLTWEGTSRWHEPRLGIQLVVHGRQEAAQATRIDTARLELQSESDRLNLQLLEPVESPAAGAVWVIDCHAEGQWSSWLARLQPVLPATASTSLDGPPLDGPLDLQLTAKVTPQSLEIDQGTLRCEPLRVNTSQLKVHEPVVVIRGKGRWEINTGRISVSEGTLQSEALAARVTDFRFDSYADRSRITGDVAFRADLEKLHAQWNLLAKQQDWRLAGSAQGQLSLIQEGDATQARWTVDLVSAELAHRSSAPHPPNVIPAGSTSTWQTVWHDPTLRLSGSGQYEGNRDIIRLDRLEVSSDDKLSLSVRGSVAEPIGTCRLDLQGQISYDLAKLLQHVAPQWKSSVTLAGQDTQQFQLHGPLFHPVGVQEVARAGQTRTASQTERGIVPQELNGEAALRWQSADLLGVELGPALIQGRLVSGAIDLGVVEMPLSGGTLRVEPTIDLHGSSPLVKVAPGQVLTDVQITPGMCHGWLKFIAPVVANSTRAEGQFSLAIQPTIIPLATPSATRGSGTLWIKSAQVAAGPMAQTTAPGRQ